MSTGNFVFVYHKDYAEVVTRNFQSFLENDLYIDLVFVCRNNKKVGAHQVVLGCLSKFFYTIFIDNFNTTKEKVLHIYVPDIRAKIMKYILQFIYSGKAVLNKEELAEFNEDIKLLGMPLDHFSPQNEETINGESAAASAAMQMPENVPSNPQIICDTVDLTELNPTNDFLQIIDVDSCRSEPTQTDALPITSNNIKLSQPQINCKSSLITNDSIDKSSQSCESLPVAEGSNSIILSDGDQNNDTSMKDETHSATKKELNEMEVLTSSRKRRKNQKPNLSTKRKTIDACIDLDESDDDSDVITIS